MQNNFWDYLFETSELIENITHNKQANLALITERLNTLELLYERSFDPVDSYQEFVAVKLIQAISTVLKSNSL